MVLLSLNIVYFEQGVGGWGGGGGGGSCNHTTCKNSIIIAISAPIYTVSTIGMMIAYWKILANIIWPSQVKWRLMIASCYRRAGNYHKVFIIIMLLLLLMMMMLLMMMRMMQADTCHALWSWAYHIATNNGWKKVSEDLFTFQDVFLRCSVCAQE